MLRKNWQNNANIRKPASCHGAIPQLTPAKYFHAMASIDYTLIVCGGMISEWIVTVRCFPDPYTLRTFLLKNNWIKTTSIIQIKW